MSTVKDVNLVVIGSGGAGLACAVTAMQKGLDKIVVLEKSPFTGGNSRMAGGHMVCVTTEDKPGTGTLDFRPERLRKSEEMGYTETMKLLGEFSS